MVKLPSGWARTAPNRLNVMITSDSRRIAPRRTRHRVMDKGIRQTRKLSIAMEMRAKSKQPKLEQFTAEDAAGTQRKECVLCVPAASSAVNCSNFACSDSERTRLTRVWQPGYVTEVVLRVIVEFMHLEIAVSQGGVRILRVLLRSASRPRGWRRGRGLRAICRACAHRRRP